MRRGLRVLTLSFAVVGCAVRSAETRRGPHTDLRLDTIADKRAAFGRAYDGFRRGNAAGVLPIFTALAASYPELADYHLYFMGACNGRLGDDRAAEAALQRLLREYPYSVKAPAAELELGTLLQRAGRDDEAQPLLQAASNAPDSSIAQAARVGLAEVDVHRGDVQGAYAGFMQVRRSAVGSAAARTAKQRALALRAQYPDLAPVGSERLDDARLLLAERDYTAVEGAVDQLLQWPEGVEPADALRLRADAQYGQGDVEAALAGLRELVDRYPSSAAAPPALLRFATVLWNRDHDAAALQAFEELRLRYSAQPHADEVIYAIGRIHERAGRIDTATQTYADLIRRFPASKLATEAQWRLAWMRYTAREWSAAAAAFAQLAGPNPSVVQQNTAQYWQARALAHAGQPTAAEALYQEIVTREPNGYYAMWAEQRLGVVATRRALPEADSLAPRPPEPAPPGSAQPTTTFHIERAAELRAAGVTDLARDELAAVERDNQNDPDTLRYLLQAYQTVEGYADAVRLLRRRNDRIDLPADTRERLLYPLAFWTIVHREAGVNAIDPFLVEAIMRQESLFDPVARSPADARGLMQLLPATARRVAAASDGPPVDPDALTEPEVNIQLGIRYLRTLLDRFDGSLLKAVAAYNGGARAVEKWEQRFPDFEADEFVESISYRETRDYVKRVVANYRSYEQLYGVSVGAESGSSFCAPAAPLRAARQPDLTPASAWTCFSAAARMRSGSDTATPVTSNISAAVVTKGPAGPA